MKLFKNKFIQLISGLILIWIINSVLNNLFGDYLDKIVSWTVRLGLDIISLGIKSFSDSIYIEISKGYYEAPSLVLLFIFSILITTGIILVILDLLSNIKNNESKSIEKDFYKLAEELINSYSSDKFQEYKNHPYQKIIEKNKLFLENFSLKKLYKQGVFLLIVTIIVSFLLISHSISKVYENNAINHFNQCMTITKPYMDTRNYIKIKSKFAQIKSKEDYAKIITNLSIIAKKNEIKLPEFTIW